MQWKNLLQSSETKKGLLERYKASLYDKESEEEFDDDKS